MGPYAHTIWVCFGHCAVLLALQHSKFEPPTYENSWIRQRRLAHISLVALILTFKYW